MSAIEGLENLEFESSTTYAILEELGRGGMGIVYLAERRCLGVGDLVVLKTMKNVTPERIEGLRREATIATRLRHDNIVRTFGLEALPYSLLPPAMIRALESPAARRAPTREHGHLLRTRTFSHAREREPGATVRVPARRPDLHEENLVLLVMDFVEGVDLRALLEEHAEAGYLLPIPLGAYVIGKVCRALAHVHKHIFHRDISPDNILVNLHGTPKLTDFGVAISATEEVLKVAGKPLYIAPECYTKGTVDEQSDIYSLGICFYQVLTGVKPFELDPRQSLIQQLTRARAEIERGIRPPVEVRSDVPEVLSNVVMRMIAPDPDDRYLRASAIADQLEQEYLYAGGFGPTSNSLAAYLRFFENEFAETDTDDIVQLGFLRDEQGRLRIQRPIGEGPSRTQVFLGSSATTTADPTEVVPLPPPAAATSAPDPAEPRAPVPPPMRPVLRVCCGDGLTRCFELGSHPITIGSAADNACALPVPGLTARHARFLRKGSENVVERVDLEARVEVNRMTVVRVALFDGDRVRLGTVQATVMMERIPDEPRRVLEVGPDTVLPELRELDARGVGLRFPATADGVRFVDRKLHALYAEVDMSDRLRADFHEGLSKTLAFVAGPESGRIEVRAYPVRARIVLDLRDLDHTGTLADLFALLVRAAVGRRAGRRPADLPPVRGIDLIEYREPDRTLRLGTSLA